MPQVQDAERLKAAEREFHDRVYTAQWPLPETPDAYLDLFRRWQTTPFYEGGWSYWGDVRREALAMVGEVKGKRLLDYGCGGGECALFFAMHGAEVTGFDLSPQGVEMARRRFAQYGIAAQLDVMDAEKLSYPDRSFDVLLGVGVLHHVIKYPGVAENAARVLKPGGRAIFVETLWDNPLINLARRFTKIDEEAGDAPLTRRAILEFARPFSAVRIYPRHLLYMLKRIAKLPRVDWGEPCRPRPLWQFVYRCDLALLRILPQLQRMCGEVIVELTR